MIVIYDQDETIIARDAFEAKGALIDCYGEKLGNEAYKAVATGCIGASYRKFGGPLVKVVSAEEAEIIREKERSIGMCR